MNHSASDFLAGNSVSVGDANNFPQVYHLSGLDSTFLIGPMVHDSHAYRNIYVTVTFNVNDCTQT